LNTDSLQNINNPVSAALRERLKAVEAQTAIIQLMQSKVKVE
jgi:hypothetical protein